MLKENEQNNFTTLNKSMIDKTHLTKNEHLNSDQEVKTNSVIHTNPINNESDWSNFKFPPRPPKRWGGSNNKNDKDEISKAPNWSAPPREIRHWHLDIENLLIVHPVKRKKIDLHKVNSKKRLIKLIKLMRSQPSHEDFSFLWRALDNAFYLTWELSLPEILSYFKDEWVWPESIKSQNEEDVEEETNK